jgi:hypothetical protein
MGHTKTLLLDENGKAISDGFFEAPQLGKALMEEPAGKRDDFKTTFEKSNPGGKTKLKLEDAFAAELPQLLDHMHDRLKIGLDEAWLSPSGYDYADQDLKSTHSTLDGTAWLDEPDEKWARAFCEKFVFAMYSGVGQAYGYLQDDIPVFNMFKDKGALPIAVACQHLSSYAVLTRGIPLSELRAGVIVGCGCSGATVDYPAFKKVAFKKQKVSPAADLTIEEKNKEYKRMGEARMNLGVPDWSTAEKLVSLGVTPGSIIVYNAGGIEYGGQDIKFPPGGSTVAAHTATILRVSGKKVQFIDTGVVTGGAAGEGGTSDHGFLEGDRSVASAESLVAVGVVRDSKDQMEEFTKRTVEAHMLGVVRLVIVRTGSDELAFVSKLLPMKWPLSRLIWSLRNLPVDGLTVGWLVYLPGDKKSTEALAGNSAFAAPSTIFGSGTILKLSHVLLSNGDKAEVYRVRNFESWRHNFDSTAIDIPLDQTQLKKDPNSKVRVSPWCPGKANSWLLDPGSKKRLLVWSASTDNMNSRLIRPKSGADATIDSGATGHPLVDP